jgi:hypothetical protein
MYADKNALFLLIYRKIDNEFDPESDQKEQGKTEVRR